MDRVFFFFKLHSEFNSLDVIRKTLVWMPLIPLLKSCVKSQISIRLLFNIKGSPQLQRMHFLAYLEWYLATQLENDGNIFTMSHLTP